MVRRRLALLTAVICLGLCTVVLLRASSGKIKEGSKRPAVLRYFALGDSYTYGEGVANHERWPDILTASLQEEGYQIKLVGNPALTGHTTEDVIRAQLPELQRTGANLVSLLIGVNDFVQDVPPEQFRQRLQTLLAAMQAALPPEAAIILVTIPDFGKTPVGMSFGEPADLEKGVAAYNQVIREEAAERDYLLADIFPASQGVVHDASLIGKDGLHPSGKQYQVWASLIQSELESRHVLKMLDR